MEGKTKEDAEVVARESLLLTLKLIPSCCSVDYIFKAQQQHLFHIQGKGRVEREKRCKVQKRRLLELLFKKE